MSTAQTDVMVTRPAWSRPMLSTDRDEVRSAALAYTIASHCKSNAKVLLTLHAGGVIRARVVAVIGTMVHLQHGIRVDLAEVATVQKVKS